MKYKGRYIHTITAEDVRSPLSLRGKFNFFAMTNTMGRLFPGDIGKQVYEVNGTVQVENDEQMKTRLNS